MNSLNKMTVIGRLTRDPELRETEKGVKVANICLACERNYKSKDNEKIVDFLEFALWDKNAENFCNFAKKGSLIYIEGYNTMKNIGTEKEPVRVFSPVVTSFQHLAYSNNKTEEEKETSSEMEK